MLPQQPKSVEMTTAIARAYAAGALTPVEAADQMRQCAPGDPALPECRHGIHCAVKLNEQPACVLCWVERKRGQS